MAMPIITLTSDDVAHLANPHIDASVKPRIIIERAIVRRTAQALLDAGFKLSVDNGEEESQLTDSIDAVMAEVMATDEEHLRVWKRAAEPSTSYRAAGYVFFVYGNSGWDVMSDYSTNLEEVLKPVNDWADTLDSGYICEGPDAAQARALLGNLLAWIHATGVLNNPALAGVNQKPLDDACSFLEGGAA